MTHAMSPLSETGRLRIARCVVDHGWSRLSDGRHAPISDPDTDGCRALR